MEDEGMTSTERKAVMKVIARLPLCRGWNSVPCNDHATHWGDCDPAFYLCSAHVELWDKVHNPPASPLPWGTALEEFIRVFLKSTPESEGALRAWKLQDENHGDG